MRKFLRLIPALTLLIGLFSACKKDKENPVVMVNSPEDNGTYKWGSTLLLDMTFTDNESIYAYRVYLGDEHGITSPEFLFDYKSSLIDGSSFSFHEQEIIPEGIVGFYYLYIEVSDDEGNEVIKQMRLNFEQ